jgi:hypothetical protein
MRDMKSLILKELVAVFITKQNRNRVDQLC